MPRALLKTQGREEPNLLPKAALANAGTAAFLGDSRLHCEK